MNDNKLIKVLLVILVVVCLFQGCSLSSMNTTVQNLDRRLEEMDSNFNNLKNRIEILESNVSNTQNIQMEASYTVDRINLDTGKIEVKFDINMVHVTENTRIVVGNGNGSFELLRNGNEFSGIVDYPMNTDDFETIIYQYEGDMEKANESMGFMSAGLLLSEYVSCGFDGFSSYGNDRLTLAGELVYGINLKENIKEVRLVTGNKTEVLENAIKGDVSINVSKEVEPIGEGDNAQIKEVCIECVTDNNVTYRIYPYLYAGSNYQVGDSKEGSYVTQESWLTVTKADGTTYEMILFMDKVFFE